MAATGVLSPHGVFLLGGHSNTNSLGGNDALVAKFSISGGVEWIKSYGGGDRDDI